MTRPPHVKVRRELAERGWTITKAAEVAGLTRPTVRRMFNGYPVREESALKLSCALAQTPKVALLEDAS